jgi:hypothetical protein
MRGLLHHKRGRCALGACFVGMALGFVRVSSGSILTTVVFQDSLGSASSSTVNGSTNSPTASSTNYDIASTVAMTSDINSTSLQMVMPSTKSAIGEAQALFTTTPVSLSQVGSDAIELTVAFTDQGGVGQGSASSAIYVGLYNSGGSAPDNNLMNSGLGNGSAQRGDATGAAANWAGYVEQTFCFASTPMIVTRPAQTGSGVANNSNQDTVSDNAVSSSSYHNPAGDNLTTSAVGLPATNLTTGSQYTDELLITLTGANTYTISSNLYAGATDSGTPIATATGMNTVSAHFLTSSFDAMSFGWRYSSSASATPEMDVNSVTVSTTVAVPEPATMGIVAASAILLARRKRLMGRRHT